MRHAPPSLALRDIEPDDVTWMVQAHRDLYARDEGFDDTFGDVVETAVRGFLHRRDPARHGGWIAWHGDARVGSIVCERADVAAAARIRLFLLLPDYRGQGFGQQLLDHALAFAQARGYQRLLVSTYTSHAAACALYERAGFSVERTLPAQAFGRELVEVHLQKALAPKDAPPIPGPAP